MSQTDPDSQVSLAEAALRTNPGNEEIKKRLVTVRSRKEQITAIAEKAHHRSGRFPAIPRSREDSCRFCASFTRSIPDWSRKSGDWSVWKTEASGGKRAPATRAAPSRSAGRDRRGGRRIPQGQGVAEPRRNIWRRSRPSIARQSWSSKAFCRNPGTARGVGGSGSRSCRQHGCRCADSLGRGGAARESGE